MGQKRTEADRIGQKRTRKCPGGTNGFGISDFGFLWGEKEARFWNSLLWKVLPCRGDAPCSLIGCGNLANLPGRLERFFAKGVSHLAENGRVDFSFGESDADWHDPTLGRRTVVATRKAGEQFPRCSQIVHRLREESTWHPAVCSHWPQWEPAAMESRPGPIPSAVWPARRRRAW